MTLAEFFGHAIRLETAAEQAYRDLVQRVLDQKRLDAMEFFDQMAEYARLHREAMQAEAAALDIPLPASATHATVAVENPTGAPASVALEDAMQEALDAERRGVRFYADVAAAAEDDELRRIAATFADEERAHVAALERFMGLRAY